MILKCTTPDGETQYVIAQHITSFKAGAYLRVNQDRDDMYGFQTNQRLTGTEIHLSDKRSIVVVEPCEIIEQRFENTMSQTDFVYFDEEVPLD